jgi:hypothetical protein
MRERHEHDMTVWRKPESLAYVEPQRLRLFNLSPKPVWFHRPTSQTRRRVGSRGQP